MDGEFEQLSGWELFGGGLVAEFQHLRSFWNLVRRARSVVLMPASGA
jgi:hypothetical protein